MGRENLNYRRGRSGRPYERLKKRVYATETHCCLCGEEVDLTLPYIDPTTGKPDPWSKSLEHPDIEADPYDAHLSHLSCNVRKGASDGGRIIAARRRGIPLVTELITSPDWE